MSESVHPRWMVTLYHDEPDNASENVGSLPDVFDSRPLAVRAARKALTDYWQTASIECGEYHPAVLGVRPDRFETDLHKRTRVGDGWSEDDLL